MENTIGGFNSFRNVLSIGVNILEGEIEASKKNYDKAIQFLTKAVEIEDNLLYQEPPDWYHPARQVLGGILLDAKKPILAEQRFREDLNQYRKNGWSLFGLYQSLHAQGKKKEALEVKKEFDKAFAKADITLKSVRYWGSLISSSYGQPQFDFFPYRIKVEYVNETIGVNWAVVVFFKILSTWPK